MPTVVEMGDDPWILIGPIGMACHADMLDYRIDFHRIDSVNGVVQRMGNVVARACPDDQYVVEWLAAAVRLEQMQERIGGSRPLEAHQSLMPDAVNRDKTRGLVVKDGIIGRPAEADLMPLRKYPGQNEKQRHCHERQDARQG